MRIIGLLILAAAAQTGCSGAHGSAEPPPVPVEQAPRTEPSALELPARIAPRRQTRTTERDFDADGIADYRVFVIENFDAEGKLVSMTEEQDFEADGVIDARDTTNFR